MTMKNILFGAALLLLLPLRTQASITLTPSSLTSRDVLAIGVVTHSGAAGTQTGSAISVSQNVIAIEQTVKLNCSLQFPTDATSMFDVGPLAPGHYIVKVTTRYTPATSLCFDFSVTETREFDVIDAAAVPLFDWRGSVATIALMLVIALFALRR